MYVSISIAQNMYFILYVYIYIYMNMCKRIVKLICHRSNILYVSQCCDWESNCNSFNFPFFFLSSSYALVLKHRVYLLKFCFLPYDKSFETIWKESNARGFESSISSFACAYMYTLHIFLIKKSISSQKIISLEIVQVFHIVRFSWKLLYKLRFVYSRFFIVLKTPINVLGPYVYI